MLRYLSTEQLHRSPYLRDSMEQDTGAPLDPRGGDDPLYLLWQRGDGRHGGSMRFLPLSGCLPVWQCSRFCLSPDPDPLVAAALFLGAAEIFDRFRLHHFRCCCDARFTRLCIGIGARPHLQTCKGATDTASLVPNATVKARAARLARLTLGQSAMWFERAFPGCSDRKETQIHMFTKQRP
ncbi:hypothetical protein TG4357_02131 [Thalassovita gelatinovora]|uniref:Uncharacterized protein n=1 Tax=Thalassovita gelatinovora TaxID=53501 RepID=A0A0N7LVC6_THAGE|nr:hypothetical protein [Thalassovita gelatinovora]QIZ80482.1 hypothetical protein HFZ77_08315 [Thalassovita gelatinovora]CUH65922.1 hypothetical protein TG4357_02131 [Thalassovita gelatinovora]SEQ73781.1 acyl homoserine lactone synthase [Thalassovita gelatinovora]